MAINSTKSSRSGKRSWADEVEQEVHVPMRQHSIWDNFDINKISNAFKLEFIPPIVNVGPHPPFEMLKGFIQRVWAKHRIAKIAMLKNGIYGHSEEVCTEKKIPKGKPEIMQTAKTKEQPIEQTSASSDLCSSNTRGEQVQALKAKTNLSIEKQSNQPSLG
ncbi:hypothetical protein HAX54_011187 [Datura stramonium]|uniref:Uncharacterized protein n=1 Tax=Datura stramonium TaxID=4076 RepID=A0ABS8TJ80_DATST|nr:hypothetical protein [Datura stramonium]